MRVDGAHDAGLLADFFGLVGGDGAPRNGAANGPDEKGRAKGWTLTEHGVAFSRALSRAIAIWEEVLGSRVDLPATVDALGRVVKTMVNRPSADGWRMLVPDELRKESITAHFVLSTGAVVEEVAEAESTAAIGPAVDGRGDGEGP